MRGRKPSVDLEASARVKVKKPKKVIYQDDKTLLIESVFNKANIDVYDDKTSLEKPDLEATSVVKNVPFTTVWGKKKFSHFLLKVAGREQLVRIDYHAQHVGGTVEEKIPYWIENAIHVPEDVVLILDGEGFAKEAKEYAIKRGEAVTHKSVKVFASLNTALSYITNLIIPSIETDEEEIQEPEGPEDMQEYDIPHEEYYENF